jgi:hypothetical protein
MKSLKHQKLLQKKKIQNFMIYIHSARLGKTDNFRVQHVKKRKTGL